MPAAHQAAAPVAAKPSAPTALALGPVDGRGPDRGRSVVRLTSGRTTKLRRVAVAWPEPERLSLKWDEPADRVVLAWPTEP